MTVTNNGLLSAWHTRRLLQDGNLDNVHFICAGHTAAGTAAAGNYLAEKWQDMISLYQEADLNRRLAIVISRPKTFAIVCAVTIDKLHSLKHV